MRFNFFPLVWSFCSLPSGLFFLRCLKRFLLRQASRARADGYDRQSEGVVRITSNTLSPKGKGRFYGIRTEYRGHSETAIYLCIEKKKGNDGHSSIGTTIGSEDFPHSTLGKRPPPNRNNLFETPRNRPIFAP